MPDGPVILRPKAAAAFLRQHVRNQKQPVLRVVEGREARKVHEDSVVQVHVRLDTRREMLKLAHRLVG